jgi:hypothetical protein
LDTPSREVAVVMCEKPRWSSTRHASTVAPSRRVAPAFITAFAGYGHRDGARIGFPSYLVKSELADVTRGLYPAWIRQNRSPTR